MEKSDTNTKKKKYEIRTLLAECLEGLSEGAAQDLSTLFETTNPTMRGLYSHDARMVAAAENANTSTKERPLPVKLKSTNEQRQQETDEEME